MSALNRLALLYERYWWILGILACSLLAFLVAATLLGIWRAYKQDEQVRHERGE